jgi:hypothetical protein
MANLMAASRFPRLIDDRLTAVFENKLNAYAPKMIETCYKVSDTDKMFDEYADVEALPDIPEFNGSLSYISNAPGYYTKIEQKEYGAITQFERKLIDFKRYSVLDDRVGNLAIALNRTMEKKAVRPFANAFSAAFDMMSSEEGVSLCSTAHLTKVPGVSTSSGFSNSGTTGLSKTAVSAARLAGKRLRMNNGELANINLDTLIVPSSLYDLACEVTGYDPRTDVSSDLDPDSANRKINVARGIKVLEWTYLDDYSTKSWFFVDYAAMKQFLLWNNSQKADIQNRMDFNTLAIETSLYARFAYGFAAWNWIYGNQVS